MKDMYDLHEHLHCCQPIYELKITGMGGHLHACECGAVYSREFGRVCHQVHVSEAELDVWNLTLPSEVMRKIATFNKIYVVRQLDGNWNLGKLVADDRRPAGVLVAHSGTDPMKADAVKEAVKKMEEEATVSEDASWIYASGNPVADEKALEEVKNAQISDEAGDIMFGKRHIEVDTETKDKDKPISAHMVIHNDEIVNESMASLTKGNLIAEQCRIYDGMKNLEEINVDKNGQVTARVAMNYSMITVDVDLK